MEPCAKLSRPQLPRVHPRTRLFRRLDAARRRKAIWVAGLPGAGKTTLVASWLERRRLRALWYHVDVGDADVASFFYLVAAAARRVHRRIQLPAFTPEYRGGLEVFSRRYFRELAAHVRAPLVIVLDNVHELPPEAALHDALAHGIEELPRGVTAVLVSRGEPPAAYARLRAYGAMAMIDADELKLSSREARAIARTRGAALPSARAAALAARADGWAAGLVLLLEQRGVSAAAAAAARTPQALFDFFAGEIFARTGATEREVLLATALLGHPTGAVARAVCGDHAARVLADCARRGYFTVRQAGSERYEYHPLFREFLLARGRELIAPARLAALRRAAARALERDGELDDAVALLREDRAWDDVRRIALAQAPVLVATGRGDTLLRWVEGIPAEALERSPALLHWIGAARLPAGPAEARRWHERAFELHRAAGDAEGMYLAWATVVETYVWEWSDFSGLDGWIEALEDLQRRHPRAPPGEIGARVALAAVAALAFHRPDHPDLGRWCEQARALALSDAVPLQVRVVAGTYLVVVEGWILGDLERARRVVEALAPLARARDVDPATAILWRSGEAPFHWNAGDADAARRATAEGLDLARTSGIHLWDFMLHLQGVWSALAADDLADAERWLERMRGTIVPARTLQSACWHLAAALVALRAADPATALRHAREAVAESTSAGYPFASALGHLAAGRALSLAGAQADARAEIAEAARFGAAARSAYFAYECALAEAQVALSSGDERGALAPMAAALALGRERGLVNHLWFGRTDTAALCALALEHGVEPAEARRLALARGCSPPRRARDLEGWPWPVEIRVLGGIAVRRAGAVHHSGPIHRRSVALLGALVATGEEGAAQERIEEMLWPDSDGDAAHHALETALYRLRRVLGAHDVIVQREGRIAIDAGRCFVDAWALDRRLSRGLALLGGARGEGGELARIAAHVRSLHRGPFLAGACDVGPCAGYRERLEARVARLLGSSSELPGRAESM
jgi:LuxR family transcriptional regulator, maltose regulon positive regulatory protein